MSNDVARLVARMVFFEVWSARPRDLAELAEENAAMLECCHCGTRTMVPAVLRQSWVSHHALCAQSVGRARGHAVKGR